MQCSLTVTSTAPAKRIKADLPASEVHTTIIPFEVLDIIFSYLPPGDIFYTVPLVSKYCTTLANRSTIYKLSVLRDHFWVKNLESALAAKRQQISDKGKPALFPHFFSQHGKISTKIYYQPPLMVLLTQMLVKNFMKLTKNFA